MKLSRRALIASVTGVGAALTVAGLGAGVALAGTSMTATDEGDYVLVTWPSSIGADAAAEAGQIATLYKKVGDSLTFINRIASGVSQLQVPSGLQVGDTVAIVWSDSVTHDAALQPEGNVAVMATTIVVAATASASATTSASPSSSATASATASASATTSSSAKYAVALWEVDPSSTDGYWPQNLIAIVRGLDDPDLGYYDGSDLLACGGRFQVDVYHDNQDDGTSAQVDTLVNVHVLTGAGNPPEPLIEGGSGVAYKIIDTDACTSASASPSESASASASPSESVSASPSVSPSASSSPSVANKPENGRSTATATVTSTSSGGGDLPDTGDGSSAPGAVLGIAALGALAVGAFRRLSA